MGKIVTQTIKRFDGGMQLDTRVPKSNGAQLVKYFDHLAFPHKLVPHNSSESGNDTTGRAIQRFLFANSLLYGYGNVDGDSSSVQVYSKSDFTGGAWNTLASSSDATITPDFNLFVAYRYGGTLYLFGARGSGGTGAIWRNTPGSAFDGNHQAISFTNIRQGLVHSKDDILYIPYDNIIAKNNAGTWNTTALTLPTDCIIQSICEFGNYLAIATSPLPVAGRFSSRVYLWDRDATLTTLSESIEVGQERIMALHEYEGTLISIGYLGKRVIARQYQGTAGFVKIADIRSTAVATPILNTDSQKSNDRIYFLADITIDGTQHEGVWSFGRNQAGEFSFAFDRTSNNDTDVNSIQSFHFESISGIDYMFVAYTDASSNKQVSKTDDSTTTFSASSVYETLINPIGIEGVDKDLVDVSKKKDLVGATVMHEPLPTAGSITVKYKTDEDSAWSTAIITNTTDDSLFASAVASLPKAWREIRFQLISTGGCALTGFKYTAEITGGDVYESN